MKARLVRTKDGTLKLLLANRMIKTAEEKDIHSLLSCFKNIDTLFNEEEKWSNLEIKDISDYPGKTLAYITDDLDLVIKDVFPITILINNALKTSFLSAAEYSKKVRKSVEQIKVYCRNGRLNGAYKVGREWLIPEDAPYPADNRIKINRRDNS